MTVDKSKVSAREESTAFESFNLASYILFLKFSKSPMVASTLYFPLPPENVTWEITLVRERVVMSSAIITP